METLNIKGMQKNNRLSKNIQEKSWHMFTKNNRTKKHMNTDEH